MEAFQMDCINNCYSSCFISDFINFKVLHHTWASAMGGGEGPMLPAPFKNSPFTPGSLNCMYFFVPCLNEVGGGGLLNDPSSVFPLGGQFENNHRKFYILQVLQWAMLPPQTLPKFNHLPLRGTPRAMRAAFFSLALTGLWELHCTPTVQTAQPQSEYFSVSESVINKCFNFRVPFAKTDVTNTAFWRPKFFTPGETKWVLWLWLSWKTIRASQYQHYTMLGWFPGWWIIH